jgi:HAD superfamily hydrolase (TIGR01509 family)
MEPRGAVIFDFDGTLTKPCLDFDAIRAEIGVTGPILEALSGLDPAARARAERIVLRHEWEAARRAELHDGASEVLAVLRSRGMPTAILTRNARATVEHVLARFNLSVDALRTREDGAIKPAAEPVLSLCAQLGAAPTQSWVVGDYLFDILSGRAAGTRTVLMIGDAARPPFADQADHVIQCLEELLPIVLS